jgi:hypothetical protein
VSIRGYKVKARVVTFYVSRGGIDAEFDVTRRVMLEWSADDLVAELKRHGIPERDVRDAYRASTLGTK